MPASDEQLLDLRQTAALLGISPAHLRRLSDRGDAPQGLHLGRSRRWSRRAIEEWLAAGCPGRNRVSRRSS